MRLSALHETGLVARGRCHGRMVPPTKSTASRGSRRVQASTGGSGSNEGLNQFGVIDGDITPASRP